jgi:CheY-like chemotaxis protein/two-component sensor histidine kinase
MIDVDIEEEADEAESQNHLLQRDRMAALGTLSAGVAHEINNPLTYVLVNLEHVLRRLRAAGASHDPAAELASGTPEGLAGLVQALQHAAEGAHRIRHVVGDLLTFAQGDVERSGLLDVRGIVESASQLAWHEIRHRARLSKSFGEVPLIEANEARLGQVFLNLLINAAHAIPEGQADRHEIRIATRTDESGNAVVEVSDTGVGIAPEDLPRVFDPFFTTKGHESTGLGLAMSHGTIRRLRGQITVESDVGRGTTFRVVLRSAQPPRSAAPSSRKDLRLRPRKRVLLIDDEKRLGEAIARALSDDHDVELESEARQALERLRSGETFDVILCDLMMPVMSGMDLYAEVMQRDPKLASRFIFMTGGAFSARAQAFMQTASNPCLQKPVDMGHLRSLVARAKAR